MNELPAGWVVTPLGELLHAIEAGQNVKCEERAPQGNEAGLVKISAVTWGRFDEAASKTLPQDAAVNERNRIRPGDLLISRANTIELVGASVLVGPIEKRLYLSDKVLRLVVDEPAKRWINYALKTPQLRQAIQSASTGNQLSMRNIPQERLRALNIPLAPAAEQIRITDQLETLLARIYACIDRLDAIPKLLKRFRRAVIRDAATGRLTRAWRESQVEPVPEWKNICVKDAGRVQLGRQRAPQFHFGEHMRPYLRVQNVFEARIDLSDVMEMNFPPEDFERFQLHPGDILLNEGQSPELLGRPAIYRGELPGACFTNTLIRFQAGPDVLPEFALIVFRNHMHSGRYVMEGKITTNLAHLGAGRFAQVEFPLPSIDEQREIVRFTDNLLGLAARIEARHMDVAKHAQRLAPLTLAKAFRGELVQQDPNDEPASVLLQRLANAPTVAVKARRGRARSKPANPPAPLATAHPDWTSLPAGAWAAGAHIDEHATAALLIAVLKAWGQPTPQDQARLAAMLCLQPRLFTAALLAHDAAPWRRLVGAEAEPLPASVATLQPAVNTHWRRALAGLRARGDLVASGSGPRDTWSLGPGADRVDTAGWPDGRAGWVVAYLRTHGVEAVLPLLPTAAVDFVHAHAA